jgi:hypothetical protein
MNYRPDPTLSPPRQRSLRRRSDQTSLLTVLDDLRIQLVLDSRRFATIGTEQPRSNADTGRSQIQRREYVESSEEQSGTFGTSQSLEKTLVVAAKRPR